MIMACLLASCAQQVSLSGGPKDEIPPQLDKTKSAPNYVTNFEKQDVELYFDEYVDLKDASKQIIISPPLSYPPIIKSRLKRLRIGFDEREELKDNVTYLVNFGKSIRDFTEGNEVVNFAYVFSTGDYIDSLTVSGEVQDVLTSKPVEDAVVMLYIDDRDSIVYQERPFYFARTNKEGKFKLKNLRADTFKVVAIKDDDLNYIYNPLNEEIGFLSDPIILNQDSISGLTIELWKESTASLYISYDIVAKGKINLEFDGDVMPDDVNVLGNIEHYIEQNQEGKSPLILWYKPTGASRISWITETRAGQDTISARINQRTTDTLDGDLQIIKWDYDKGTGLHPLSNLALKANTPLSIIDTSLITFTDTAASANILFSLDSSSFPKSNLEINASWPAGNQILVDILPGALIDFFGKTNDTITKYIEIGTVTNFGAIEITLTNFDSSTYVIQLLKDKKILEERLKTSDITKLTFERMIPGQYDVMIITDTNGNGKWDPGNYLEKKQAERIYTVSLDPLREDWVLEFTLDLQEVINRPPANNKSRDQAK